MNPEDKKDPLKNPKFRKPGFLESLAETLFGLSRPLQCVQIEVSSACMGKCSYCPHSSQSDKWKTRHIRPETFARLWPLFKVSSQAHLQGWGEPLLHPRFFDLVALAKKAGCHVSTTSCGLIMNEDISDKLTSGNLDLIAFSLAGTDRESNKSRVDVDFDLVCNNIKFLQESIARKNSNLEIHLAYILLANQLEALHRIPDLMDKLGVNTTIISTLDYLAVPKDRELAFYPEDIDKINSARVILKEIAQKARENGKEIHYALPGKRTMLHENGCRENIRKTLYIDADGNVSPCVYLNVPGSDLPEQRRVYGNVAENEPLDIWKKEEFKTFRKMLVGGEPDSVCLNCPKRLEVVDE